MARVDNFSREMISGFHGILDFYRWRGRAVVRSWPTYSPGRVPTARQAAWRAKYGDAARLLGTMNGVMRAQWKVAPLGKGNLWIDSVKYLGVEAVKRGHGRDILPTDVEAVLDGDDVVITVAGLGAGPWYVRVLAQASHFWHKVIVQARGERWRWNRASWAEFKAFPLVGPSGLPEVGVLDTVGPQERRYAYGQAPTLEAAEVSCWDSYRAEAWYEDVRPDWGGQSMWFPWGEEFVVFIDGMRSYVGYNGFSWGGEAWGRHYPALPSELVFATGDNQVSYACGYARIAGQDEELLFSKAEGPWYVDASVFEWPSEESDGLLWFELAPGENDTFFGVPVEQDVNGGGMFLLDGATTIDVYFPVEGDFVARFKRSDLPTGRDWYFCVVHEDGTYSLVPPTLIPS